MRSVAYICLLSIMMIGLACAAGCTFSRNASPVSSPLVPTTAAGAPGGYGTPTVQATSANLAVNPAGIDTTINIHYNDYDCLDVQQALGVVYLNPDQKYTIRVSPPNSQVNVNLLFLDVGDKEKLQAARPEWNAIAKTWEYESIVPLLQFNDISTIQEKTVTIKNQGKYFLCADDRKETGVNDAVIRVPVKMTRVG
jgi:hypothetical protein